MTTFAIEGADVRDPTGLSESTVRSKITAFAVECGCTSQQVDEAVAFALRVAGDTFTAIRMGRRYALYLSRGLQPIPLTGET
jgi:hypothetical protein